MITNKFKDKKQLMLAVACYTGGSIFGPLILFGGIGYFIDQKLDSKPLYMLVGVGIAFIFTNILVAKKARQLAKDMEEAAKSDNNDGKKDNKNIKN